MKKWYVTIEGREYQRIIRRGRAHRKRKSNKKGKRRNRRIGQVRQRQWQGWDRRGEPRRIRMGTVLDPCQAESRANEKCEEIEEELNKGSGEVFVDIEEVEEFSLAGVIMLASAIERGMRSDARSKKGVRGNVPANEEIRREFNESGFFTWLGLPETQADQERSTWTSARSKKVVSNRAAELVRVC